MKDGFPSFSGESADLPVASLLCVKLVRIHGFPSDIVRCR